MATMSRRRLLGLGLRALGLSACPLGAAARAADEEFQGCFLRAASSTLLDRITVRLSSGDKEADQVCIAAEQELRREFRVAPDTWFYDDGKYPNALATWLRRSDGASNDGTVFLGLRLVARVTRRDALNRHWQLRLTSIVAHEWAHIVQYSRGRRAPGKGAELHANFLAGWFLARTGVTGGGSEAGRGDSMLRMYGLGDYEYGHPDHHGTPLERAFAIGDGFDFAKAGHDLDAAFAARPL